MVAYSVDKPSKPSFQQVVPSVLGSREGSESQYVVYRNKLILHIKLEVWQASLFFMGKG